MSTELPYTSDHLLNNESGEPATDDASKLTDLAFGDGTTLMVSDGWSKNEKIKTCKCEVCGERVRRWSVQCTKCLRHVCSECLDPGSTKSDYQKRVAQNQTQEGCWHRFRSNMHPSFAKSKPLPPLRLEEERRARASKVLAATTRAAKQRDPYKQKPASTKDFRESSLSSCSARIVGDPDDDFVGGLATEAPTSGQCLTRKRKRGLETHEDRSEDAKTDGEQASAHKVHELVQELLGPTQDANGVSDQDMGHNRGFTSEYGPGTSKADRTRKDDLLEIVVIGAGVVGLFVARELALEARKAEISIHVTVVDIRSGHCQLASGHCNGILGTHFIPEEWLSLTQTAKDAWLSILSHPEEQQSLDFKLGTSIGMMQDGSSSTKACPSWLKGAGDSPIGTAPDTIGRIDPWMLASWLLSQCQSLGVSFRFGCTVTGCTFNDQGRLASTTLKHHEVKVTDERLLCSNLVLAAGPFTTSVLDQLFPDNNVAIESNKSAAHWFTFHASVDSTTDDIAVILPQGAAAEKRLQPAVALLPRPNDDFVKITAFGARLSNESLKEAEALLDRPGKVTTLRSMVAPLLNSESMDLNDKKHILATGRSELCVANGGRPIIDRLPSAALGLSGVGGQQDSHPGGAWLCYGFGQYGTMLAPGAARLLVSRMFEGGSDVGEFCIPPYDESQPEGKGKGKATL